MWRTYFIVVLLGITCAFWWQFPLSAHRFGISYSLSFSFCCQRCRPLNSRLYCVCVGVYFCLTFVAFIFSPKIWFKSHQIPHTEFKWTFFVFGFVNFTMICTSYYNIEWFPVTGHRLEHQFVAKTVRARTHTMTTADDRSWQTTNDWRAFRFLLKRYLITMSRSSVSGDNTSNWRRRGDNDMDWKTSFI